MFSSHFRIVCHSLDEMKQNRMFETFTFCLFRQQQQRQQQHQQKQKNELFAASLRMTKIQNLLAVFHVMTRTWSEKYYFSGEFEAVIVQTRFILCSLSADTKLTFRNAILLLENLFKSH